jgi:hypothetical protein
VQDGSGRNAGIGVAKLRTHRAVIRALAFQALVRVNGVDLFDVADGSVGALGFAGTASLAEFGEDFVSHDDLLKKRVEQLKSRRDLCALIE